MGKKSSKQKSVPSPELKSANKKASASEKTKWLLAASFFVLGFALYAPSISYDFVYDDDAVIKENRFVKKGMDGIKEIWTTSYFKGYDENMNARAFRPIPMTMFALEVDFLGLNPKVHHFINVLFYGLTGALLFFFLARLFKKENLWLAATITLFFLVNPVHIEVIANIKSRDELMAFFSFALTAWLWLKAVDEKKSWLLGLSWLSYAVALFSKESALTTLAMFPLMLWFFREKNWKQIALSSLPFLALAVIYLIVRSSIVGGLNEGVALTVLDNSLLAASSTSERIASNIYVLGLYFYKNLVPFPLLSDYSFSTIPLKNWSDWEVWASILLYAGLIYVAIVGLLKKWIPAYGVWHFFATVSIFSSVIVLNVSPYNDRFNYNPSLGVCILLAWILFYFFYKNENKTSSKKYILIALVALISLAGIARIYQHQPVWENRFTLFDHDVELAPNNARMLKNKGGSLVRQAVAETDKEKQAQIADEAIVYLEKALNIYERLPTSHVYLGIMYGIKGELEKAEISYKNALVIDSNNVYAKTNLANIFYRQGKIHESLELLQQVKPELYSANDKYLLYLIYNKLGDFETAMKWKEQSGR
jgi:tetratricopeptide (TPR) repeat protein